MLLSCLATSKSSYYTNKIIACEGNQKVIFNVVNNVFNRKQATISDPFHSIDEPAEGFKGYFQQKIQNN